MPLHYDGNSAYMIPSGEALPLPEAPLPQTQLINFQTFKKNIFCQLFLQQSVTLFSFLLLLYKRRRYSLEPHGRNSIRRTGRTLPRGQ